MIYNSLNRIYFSSMLTELTIRHFSAHSWSRPDMWADYFAHLESVLQAPLTHLDVNDPVRRKVSTLTDAGQYVCSFEPSEDNRWVFGRFKSRRVEFTIEHRIFVTTRCNNIGVYPYCPKMDITRRDHIVKQIFDVGNRILHPFYSTAETDSVVYLKKKSSGAVDLERELIGIFWLTYLNNAYVRFFGSSKFDSLPFARREPDGGVTLELADSPTAVPVELRAQIEDYLGRDSFVHVDDVLDKPIGLHVLTFDQVRNEACTRLQ